MYLRHTPNQIAPKQDEQNPFGVLLVRLCTAEFCGLGFARQALSFATIAAFAVFAGAVAGFATVAASAGVAAVAGCRRFAARAAFAVFAGAVAGFATVAAGASVTAAAGCRRFAARAAFAVFAGAVARFATVAASAEVSATAGCLCLIDFHFRAAAACGRLAGIAIAVDRNGNAHEEERSDDRSEDNVVLCHDKFPFG